MTPSSTPIRRWIVLIPALTTLSYPFLLRAARTLYMAPLPAGKLLAAMLLVFISLLPGVGIWQAWKKGGAPSSSLELRARWFALVALAAPPLFVLLAFVLSILDHPVPELAAWIALWVGACLWAWSGPAADARRMTGPPKAAARVAHGTVAALLALFISFHLLNHSLGWLGPETHAQFMHWGRNFYRLPVVEGALVILLVSQLCLGAWLAHRWTAQELDGFRLTQVATGVYLGFFVLTHMNSALLSARWLHGIDTDWAWASGEPAGLLGDDWNIRLVPHYLLGVFCVLAHLVCGLRAVMLAHGWRRAHADRLWVAGLVAAGLVAIFILMGLAGH